MLKRTLILLACLAQLTGCASIVSGTRQNITVHNGSVSGAVCTLTNSKGNWLVGNTPHSVFVHRAYDDLQIECKKPGYKTAYHNAISSTRVLAFGNIVFGGVIGAAVDIVDGAAYDYPYSIYVPMERK